MGKKILNVCMLTAVLLAMAVLTGCGDSSKKKLLSTIPADAELVMYMDVQTVYDQLEIKKDGDSYSYCKELKDIVDASGMDKKTLKEALKMVDETEKYIAIFYTDNNLWMTFNVKDGDDFCDYVRQLDKSMDVETVDGYKVIDHTMAVSDKQVWLSDNIDTSTLKLFESLSDDNKFSERFDKVADEMVSPEVMAATFYNINNMMKVANLSQEEVAGVRMILSMAFDDAEYVFGVGRLTSDGMEGESRVLNEKQENAKFLLPMSKITGESLSKIDNNAPLVAAASISPELVTKIVNMVSNMGHMSSEDTEGFNLVKNISGTSAFSFSGPNDFIVSIGFKDGQAAENFGRFLATLGAPYPSSVAGNSLLMRSNENLRGSGKAPSEFIGKYMAARIDFSKIDEKLVSGYDFSKLGTILCTVEPEGDGIVAKSVWKMKNPIRTLLSEGFKIFTTCMGGGISTAFDSNVDDDYSIYEEPVEVAVDSALEVEAASEYAY